MQSMWQMNFRASNVYISTVDVFFTINALNSNVSKSPSNEVDMGSRISEDTPGLSFEILKLYKLTLRIVPFKSTCTKVQFELNQNLRIFDTVLFYLKSRRLIYFYILF